MRRFAYVLWIPAIALLTPLGALGQEPAQETETPAQDEAMAAYQAAAAPGAEHEWLAGMAGKFEVTTKMWMDPAGEPMESKSTATSKMGLGGRYLMDHYEGDFLGTNFHGMGMTGFDNTRGKFVSAWIDNMGTGILYSVGERDDDGRLVMMGEMEDPTTGMTVGLKSVTWITEDGYMMEMYNILADGTHFKSMELHAKRVE